MTSYINSNHWPISYRFRDNSDFGRIEQNFLIPGYSVPLVERYGLKTRMMSLLDRQKDDNMCIRFDTALALLGEANGQNVI